MAVHVRYQSWYISLTSSAKRQCKITRQNSSLSREREPRRLIFYIFILNLSMCPRFSFVIALTVINKENDVRVLRDSEKKYKINF